MKKSAAQGQVPHLGKLQTEATSRVARDMGSLSTFALCQALPTRKRARYRLRSRPACAPLQGWPIDEMPPRLGAGGRLIYVGAGNSGRVAQMDCAEIPVTFYINAAQFRAVVASGPRAKLVVR
ncbi:hypothetical protein BBO_08987 [Beauveria brongniartii RCEF 3172]|uniref:Uncharacterized protein n=1 Tax=Beauveria brongniartii RCEF 3172 TaxID=1081107 RepID=A0A166WMT1_9HYPO|nr:hypothetical protein BBO_08987 [Beauveria brongniartii RCEF 3172]